MPAANRGFAIGTILLAVVLIAAVVSALAISSRGSITSGDREMASIMANSMINEAVKITSSWKRSIANGSDLSLLSANINDFIAEGILSNPTFSAQNAFTNFGSNTLITISGSGSFTITNGSWFVGIKESGNPAGTGWPNQATGNRITYFWLIVTNVREDVCNAINRISLDNDRANRLLNAQTFGNLGTGNIFTDNGFARLLIRADNFLVDGYTARAQDIIIAPETPFCLGFRTGVTQETRGMFLIMPASY